MEPTGLVSEAPNPALIWETMNAHIKTAALRAAVELDLFTAIGEGVRTARALADRCKASERGVRILCDYLTIHGLLSKEADRYGLTPTSATFLDRRSPACMASTVRFLNSPKVLSGFSNLTETVRRGTTTLPQGGVTESELEEWVTFAESMPPLVGAAAEFIGDLATSGGASPKRVLDIAAGHGLFGIAIARRAPQAEIVAQDWPNVLTVANMNAKAAKLEGRYRLLPGDVFAVDFGNGFDVVLLTNFLHHFDESVCESLLKKVHKAVKPGGRVFTLEFIPNEDRVTPPFAASFSMMMLGLTPAGDAYTMTQLDRMFRAAGFSQNELMQLPNAPQRVVVSRK